VTLSQKTVAGHLTMKKRKKKSCLRSQSWVSNDDENSAVFSSQQNSCNDNTARIEDGKPFQARAAATGKARSPSVTRLVDGTISVDVAADRRRRRASTSVDWQRSRQDKVVQYH